MSTYFSSIPKMTNINLYNYKGTCISVQDGDTIHCMVSMGFDTYRELTIRLAKINAPELTSEDTITKKLAEASRDFLASLVLGKTIYFNSRQYDKYHRSIADVYLSPIDMISINQVLVDNGMAKKQRY